MRNAPRKTYPPEKIVNVPNSLTALRAVVMGYVSYLLATEWPGLEIGALFAGAMVTDWLDGKLARILHQETRFGKRFDPIVDSVSFHLPLWALAYQTDNGIMQSVYLASSGLIALRDADLLRSSIEMEQTGEQFQVSRLGKIKTAVQMTALSILIATPITRESIRDIGLAALWAGTILSLVSWSDYRSKLGRKA